MWCDIACDDTACGDIACDDAACGDIACDDMACRDIACAQQAEEETQQHVGSSGLLLVAALTLSQRNCHDAMEQQKAC